VILGSARFGATQITTQAPAERIGSGPQHHDDRACHKKSIFFTAAYTDRTRATGWFAEE